MVVCGAVIVLATCLLPASAALASGRVPTDRAAAATTGTVSGTVTVTGAPKGFTPALSGVGGCKSGAFATCSSPKFAVASGAPYTFTLPGGTWHLQGFYVLTPFGGGFLGSSATVTVQTGKTDTVNFTVAYKKPGSVNGTVSVTKVPSGITVSQKTAEACPSYAPNPKEATAELICAEGDGSGRYSLTTLSPGTWVLYPSYVTKFGQTVGTKGTTVTVVSGATRTVNLTTPYLPPPFGIVSGTAVVTSAPPGFLDPVGVLACKGSTVSITCPSLQEAPINGTSYQLPLATGTWAVEMFYLPQPYGGLEVGPTKTVDVVAAKTAKLPLTMAYKTPGTLRGQLSITGIPGQVAILSYSVLACPASSPYNGNAFDPQCAGETSGVISSPLGGDLGAEVKINDAGPVRAAVSSSTGAFSMPLPPGKWLLYPGYSTVFGPTVSTMGTPVTIAAKTVSTKDVTMAYRTPTDGSVSGTTRLLDAPTEGLGIAGVEACSSPASTSPGITCGIITMQIGPSGDYQLAVPAGTWWVAELYWYLVPQGGGFSSGEPLAGPSHKVVVKAATSYVLNLSATYGAG